MSLVSGCLFSGLAIKCLSLFVIRSIAFNIPLPLPPPPRRKAAVLIVSAAMLTDLRKRTLAAL
jgi:hypothetical protein